MTVTDRRTPAKRLILRLRITPRGKKLRINNGITKVFSKNILEEIQNSILFCIFKILFESILPITAKL